MNSSSKQPFSIFLSKEWKKEKYMGKLLEKCVYLTVDEECIKFSSQEWSMVSELSCNHEEADTRLFIHCKHASEHYENIVIASEDTDVLVIGVAMAHLFKENTLVQMARASGHILYHNISAISKELGFTLSQSLIGYHALSGNDPVSAFLGKGKASGFKLLKKNKDFQEIFCKLGDSLNTGDDLLQEIETFVCQLYISNTKINHINRARYALFTSKKGEIDSALLPPCKSALIEHIKRANYMAYIWRSSMIRHVELDDPCVHG